MASLVNSEVERVIEKDLPSNTSVSDQLDEPLRDFMTQNPSLVDALAATVNDPIQNAKELDNFVQEAFNSLGGSRDLIQSVFTGMSIKDQMALIKKRVAGIFVPDQIIIDSQNKRAAAPTVNFRLDNKDEDPS